MMAGYFEKTLDLGNQYAYVYVESKVNHQLAVGCVRMLSQDGNIYNIFKDSIGYAIYQMIKLS